MTVLQRLADGLWNPWLLGLFLLVGLYLTLASGCFPLAHWRKWLGSTLGVLLGPARGEGKNGLTRRQTLSTALASTIGTGSIAGVAAAIYYGGPGSVFWMWVSALLGMMTGCVEKILAVRYRERGPDGRWEGGPMCYLARGVGSPALAGLFSLCCVGASLAGGSIVQSNSIAAALEATLGWDRLAVGVVTALLTGLVILGGIGRIGRVSEKLVPAMALLFLAGGGAALFLRRAALPGALERIFLCALSPKAAAGGGVGYALSAALRYGVARGVFTNEAGVGSSAMAHAASGGEDPVEEGLWGIFEVWASTMVVCSVTALVILTSGVYQEQAALAALQGEGPAALAGAPLSAAAFSASLGGLGSALVTASLLLFAFTSLVGWSYYGERGLAWLTGGRGRGLYRLVFLLAAAAGSVGELGAVWQLADLCNGLMALPNLLAILVLSPQALALLREWEARQQKKGQPHRTRGGRAGRKS